MARAIQQVRNLTELNALDTTTDSRVLTPSDVPDNSTITRLVGNLYLEYIPASGSAARALIAIGLGVTDDAGAVDVALPNSHPDIWLGWWYQPLLLRTGGSSGLIQKPTSQNLPFDLHGQRVVNETTGMQLRLFARLVAAIGAGAISVKIGLTHFYKLPEQ